MLALAMPRAVTAAKQSVLVLFDERPELPGLAVLDAGLRRELTAQTPFAVDIYREPLDLSRFASPAYPDLFAGYLQRKYADGRIDVVVAVMGPALRFLVDRRNTLFPGVPIVFCGIDRRDLPNGPLPTGVTGVLLRRQFAPTVEIALALQPEVERAVVIGGTSEFDVRVLEQLRAELQRFATRLRIEEWTDRPLGDIVTRVAALPPRTIVLYSSFFRDAAGTPYVNHEALERVAAASSVPVYGFVDQYLGRGMVGGRLYSLDEHGAEAGRMAHELLAGAAVADLPPVEPINSVLLFDARALDRWHLDSDLLPAGAELRYRKTSLWRDFRAEVLAAAAVIALLVALVAAIVIQDRGRRRAESGLQRTRAELAHVARVATMGELTAAIAHELKQPLGAILADVEAATMLLANPQPPIAEIQEILDDIRDDDRRASDILGRVRRLLEKRELPRDPIPINDTAAEVLRLLDIEATERQIELRFTPASDLPAVSGDRVHLQQVLMNLVINGLEAAAGAPRGQRRLDVQTARRGAGVEIVVTDSGQGIPPAALPRLFDPFWTTKPHGLGMGLSIARSIVESHDGRIWAENVPGGGARFHVELPAVDQAAMAGAAR